MYIYEYNYSNRSSYALKENIEGLHHGIKMKITV